MVQLIYMLWSAMEQDIVSGNINSIAQLELEYGVIAISMVRTHAVMCGMEESVSHYLRTDSNNELYLCTDIPGEIQLQEEIDAMFLEMEGDELPW